MTGSKAFASQADLAEKRISFEQLSPHAWAYTAEGDPNTGVLIGRDAVMVVDTQATPVMAADVIRRIREVTPLPIKYVLLSHYHAVRVLGASAFVAEGLEQVIASDATLALIQERGEQDKASEIGRFPRLFRNVESVPAGLTWPTLTFSGRLSLDLGGVKVEMFSPGRGHTAGDTVAWLPEERVLFSGDLVEFDATPYCGDAHFADWPATLDAIAALQPLALVPGRGPALRGEAQVAAGLAGTRAFVSELYAAVQAGRAAGEDLKTVYQRAMTALRPRYGHWVIFDHCMPFDVSRAFDEAGGTAHPRIWTAERDREMWASLEG
ncbi:MAG: MBL fold metallo-hydrolase [Roseateles sp.]|nr:MAG: MBL fold metallo-hydrolase [Roseateles sp.]